MGRVYGLDLMRMWAISLVVVFHGQNLLVYQILGPFPLLRPFGNLGVDLFFVLSGFLIGGILLRVLEETPRITFRSVWDFWIRRWFRTLPNYYLWIGLNVPLAFLGVRIADGLSWKYLLFLQNLTTWDHHMFATETWSLAIEEWFYLTFPLVAVAAIAVVRDRRRGMLWTGIAFVAVPTLLRGFASVNPAMDWNEDLRQVVLYHLDGIGFGVLAAYHKRHHPDFFAARDRLRFWTGLGVIAGFCAIVYADIGGIEWILASRPWKIFGIALLSFGIALMLPRLVIWERPDGRWPVFVERMSLYSYSMYLSHIPLLTLFIAIGFRFAPWLETLPGGPWLVFVAWAAASYGVSSVCYRRFERPMMDLRDRWSKREPGAV